MAVETETPRHNRIKLLGVNKMVRKKKVKIEVPIKTLNLTKKETVEFPIEGLNLTKKSEGDEDD